MRPLLPRSDGHGIICKNSSQTAYWGSPWENGYIESFNARLRDELLNGEIFYTLREAQIVIESWRRHYKRASQHPSVYVIEENRLR